MRPHEDPRAEHLDAPAAHADARAAQADEREGRAGTRPTTTGAGEEARTDVHGGGSSGDRARPVGAPRWWRAGAAAAVVAGLVLGGTYLDELRLPTGPSGADPAGVTAEPGPGAGNAPVSSAVLGCPGPVEAQTGSGPEDAGGALALAAAAPAPVVEGLPGTVPDAGPGDAGPGADGSGTLLPVPDDGSGPGTTTIGTTPEEVVLATGTGAGVRADGSVAPGLTAAQLGVLAEPGRRWATLTPCTAPIEEHWLVAGDAAAGRSEQLVLTNPSSEAVRVDVEVWGADGPVAVTGGTGLVVPAQGRTTHLLDGLAGGAATPVVRVSSTGRPVVAHLADTWREGTTDLGAELVAASAAPSTDLVLPPLPGTGEDRDGTGEEADGAGRASDGSEEDPGGAEQDPGPERDTGDEVRVRLLAPGDQPTVVELTGLTPEGAVPLPEQVTSLEAGEVAEVTLTDLPPGPVALRVRSDEPVVAAAVLVRAPSGDEPVEAGPGDDATSTSGPDGATSTSGPDGATSTSGPDGATSTSDPDEGDAADDDRAGEDEAVTTGPGTDGASTTTGPGDRGDGAAGTAGPGQRPGEPLVRPAGELAWVGGAALSTDPLGLGLPSRDQLPGAAATLTVTAVDATSATVVWLDAEGTTTTEELASIPNDTTVELPVPTGARAAWVVPTGGSGVVAAVLLSGSDPRGPYLSAAGLPAVPWQQPVTRVQVRTP